MRSPPWIVLLLCAGCTAHVVSTVPATPVRSASSEVPAASAEASRSASAEPLPGASASEALAATAPPAAAPPGVEPEEEAEDESTDGESAEGEEESEDTANAAPDSGPFYTTEFTDESLTELWKKDVKALGSISVGFVHSGRMVNAVQFPKGDEWIVVSPELTWATQETIDYTMRAIRDVRAQHPKAPALRVNQISAKDGGYLRPHKSHQAGRDVDLGFYYPTVDPIRARERERYIDLELNWALIKSLIRHTDVQMILVDKRVQKVLKEHALSKGEDPVWVNSLFGDASLIKHARGHRDHFHVRFYNPRAQELGWRVAPLLALQPEQNVMMHRVRNGDTLGGIAMRYGSGVKAIQKASRMRNTFLRIGQVLAVPLRGPCTRCPVPPHVIVPARRLPPGLVQEAPALASTPAPALEPAVAASPAPAEPVAAPVLASPAESAPAVVTAETPAVPAGSEQTAPSVETREPAAAESPAHAASPGEPKSERALNADGSAGTTQ